VSECPSVAYVCLLVCSLSIPIGSNMTTCLSCGDGGLSCIYVYVSPIVVCDMTYIRGSAECPLEPIKRCENTICFHDIR